MKRLLLLCAFFSLSGTVLTPVGNATTAAVRYYCRATGQVFADKRDCLYHCPGRTCHPR